LESKLLTYFDHYQPNTFLFIAGVCEV